MSKTPPSSLRPLSRPLFLGGPPPRHASAEPWAPSSPPGADGSGTRSACRSPGAAPLPRSARPREGLYVALRRGPLGARAGRKTRRGELARTPGPLSAAAYPRNPARFRKKCEKAKKQSTAAVLLREGLNGHPRNGFHCRSPLRVRNSQGSLKDGKDCESYREPPRLQRRENVSEFCVNRHIDRISRLSYYSSFPQSPEGCSQWTSIRLDHREHQLKLFYMTFGHTAHCKHP